MECTLESRQTLPGVKHILIVVSGKGGVGKSTIAVQLSLILRKLGKKVGILDVDLCGPSIPHMLGLEGHDVHQCPEGWVPIYADKEQMLSVMSIGFLLKSKDDAVIWRGPKKNAMIKQFINDVYWQDLDVLVIDTPPGTSDEHLAVVEIIRDLNPDGCIVVTTPQGVSINDVRRELMFCRRTGIPILGIVENMSGYVCPHCSECTNIFASGNGEALAKQANVNFLGAVPLDPALSHSAEKGINFVETFSTSPSCEAFYKIGSMLANSVCS